MSDSDSDSALSVYDPEDNLNYYGSPVEVSASELREDCSSSGNAAVAVVENIQPQRTQFCCCKNTCCRRSGRKRHGCPCRDENLPCTEKCSCGSKKSCCKNKEEGTTMTTRNINAGKSAFDRHQAAMEEAKRDITGFIERLSEVQKDNILLNLLSNGKGSLDYARNLVKFGSDGGAVPSVPDEKPTWCTCGVCRPMATKVENKCCRKIRCITSFVTFQNTCTDREGTSSFLPLELRGNRRLCPSCVVLTIRYIFPADDGNYMGFRRA